MPGLGLKEAVDRADSVVVKRLRFVLKILKGVTLQSNNRNRQSQIYVLEVLEAISDWSGSYNPDLVELLDQEMFPQICSLVSTLSREEFHAFQKYFARYLLKRGMETLNLAALDFLSDVYGFITRISPPAVVEEFIEIFSLENMPFHITLIFLPAILRNITNDTSRNKYLQNSPVMCLLRVPNEEITPHQRQLVLQFWRLIPDTTKNLGSCQKLTPVIGQCIVTAAHLGSFKDSDLVVILQDFLDWGSIVENFLLEAFLIITTIFVSSVLAVLEQSSNPTFNAAMKNLILLVGRNAYKSTNRSIRVFTMKIFQKILERTDKDWKQVIDEFTVLFKIDEECSDKEVNANAPSSPANAEEALVVLEKCVKRISAETEIYENEPSRKRLKLLVDNLSNALYKL